MNKVTGTKKPVTIGRHVMIDLPDLNLRGIEAKVDTGAYRTVIHCLSAVETGKEEKELKVVFQFDDNPPVTYFFHDFFRKEFKSSFGETESRYCVRMKIRIGKKTITSSVSLTDRSEMKFQVLIGRKTLLRKFLVDVSRKFV